MKDYKIIIKKIFKYSGLIILAGFLLFSVKYTIQANTTSVDNEIRDLNLSIQNQRQKIDDIKEKQKEYQAKIETTIKDRLSLSNQLSILDNKMAKTELDIDSANLEIDKTGLEIKKIERERENLDEEIDEKKEHIGNLLRLAYKQDQSSTIEMLLLNDSLADFLNDTKYIADTNKEIGKSVDDLKDDKEKLDRNKLVLEEKTDELNNLKEELEEHKLNLSYEQENKEYILVKTKSSEQQYQNLLQEAKKQQAQAEAEITQAEQLIRKKMTEKDRSALDAFDNSTLSWPVPKNMITARFHDPLYPYKSVLGNHSAIDIRAAQGTTITAAGDGYVAKVKFNGTRDYAYIMIIHGDNISTVYGHISAVYVTEDQYVSRGEAIGRTGGMPGTIGAGPFSTGPHLHFEVRLNGLPVNPENYLN
ncbi:MAG: peptidoglycan DD-metalloendopeptidase family protein [Patescibacteria group bacterium]|jgi:murein DD-endopeptidase MepM/ murein hydrolase activator NlpD|nr:peptidoglycan DD-metalloendopeptidase family protein [Patescibacteria group bacterium]